MSESSALKMLQEIAEGKGRKRGDEADSRDVPRGAGDEPSLRSLRPRRGLTLHKGTDQVMMLLVKELGLPRPQASPTRHAPRDVVVATSPGSLNTGWAQPQGPQIQMANCPLPASQFDFLDFHCAQAPTCPARNTCQRKPGSASKFRLITSAQQLKDSIKEQEKFKTYRILLDHNDWYAREVARRSYRLCPSRDYCLLAAMRLLLASISGSFSLLTSIYLISCGVSRNSSSFVTVGCFRLYKAGANQLSAMHQLIMDDLPQNM